MTHLAQQIGDLLRVRKLTLAVVESATGGLISHLITNISGSSDYYKGSIISYSNDLKVKLAGVKAETLEKYGAVSAQIAQEMAVGGRKALGTDICIASTGIAGPTGATTGKPLGLFYIGLSYQGGTFNRRYVFQGNREQNKKQAAAAALTWLKEYLLSLDTDEEQSSVIQTKEVVTCFIESENKILILRRSGRVGSYQGRWAGISGFIEKTPDEQALIEIKEETGLTAKDAKLISKGQPLEVMDENLKIKWIVYPYLFYVKNPEKVKLDWEHTKSKWIFPGEIDNYVTVPKLKETLAAVKLFK
jgi:nicotinamide-nucleotide amidase